MAFKNIFYFWLMAVFSLLSFPAHAQELYGNPDDPLVAKVLDTKIHTGDPEEMRYVILSKLVEPYALEHDIAVSRADIDAYVESLRRIAENHRKQNLARRQELTRKLNSRALSDAERESLSSKLESLNELIESLDQSSDTSKENPQEIKAYREQIATAFIRQWKINRALYGQYGGRVIFQQSGPEPLDAYRRFLEEQEKRGAFTILDKAFEEKFWNYYRNDAIHSFYAPGSEEEAQAFETPWWLQELPENGQ
jgi:hypothetical protein